MRWHGYLFLASALLSGCAQQQSWMRPERVASGESAQQIVTTLDRDLAGQLPAQSTQPPVPESVTRALMPSVSLPSPALEERFDLRVDQVPARAFFDTLVAGTSYNVVVHPKILGDVSLNLRNVTVPEVMTLVGDLHDWEIVQEGGIYRVLPGGMQTRMFPINYLSIKRQGGSETQVSSGQVTGVSRSGGGDAGVDSATSRSLIGTRILTSTESDFWLQLSETLRMIVGSEDGNSVIVNPGSGMVVVRAPAAEVRAAEQYLRAAELIMQRQVILEARILEVTLNDGYQQGISWTQFSELASDIGSDGLPTKYYATSLSGELIENEIGGVFSAALRTGDFEALIELLGTQGTVQVLSSPRISTVNNQKAVIKVGTDEFFVTDITFDENTSSSSSTDSTTTDIELTPFFSGISLDVTPQISEEGNVILHVHPAVSDVVDQQKTIRLGSQDLVLPLAQSTVRETDSVISARDGQIVIIGGLIQNNTIEDHATVPLLGSVPVVGELFKQRRSSQRKSELVILLRPILGSEDSFRQDLAQSRERFGVLQRLLRPAEPEPASAGKDEGTGN